jgi:hypothetical protein
VKPYEGNAQKFGYSRLTKNRPTASLFLYQTLYFDENAFRCMYSVFEKRTQLLRSGVIGLCVQKKRVTKHDAASVQV